ncbi:hypothetical protein Kpol_1048p30 [Vanderwaltozyma polyspora DSM 70294]|uniref:Protein kinase domain-containing protein n=1 Tax=Vanderwaltozyma polyspora (strain ATCC 22028 / DSM 70294 / BCRC 21397 / CBS 2163 / NBRC 10782 / NRRL Y-8283 / UCD 57-17) TaxID=436907 RepID=A7TGJ2_VANPO|nr:uncharacterized protein Kpol_1048p30 [Vanderwaltozyma polyspora DSM 70294]EDO18599.1 hypothetical protein Kpol_1048p30 [Vanderwaltozyma polyspora DSM 70294]
MFRSFARSCNFRSFRWSEIRGFSIKRRNLMIYSASAALIGYHSSNSVLKKYNLGGRMLFNDSLIPDPRGDTYEMGLFIASQNDWEDQVVNERNLTVKNSRNRLYRYCNVLMYKIGDFMEPIMVFLRFIELSCIFVPIFCLYPISYYGKLVILNNNNNNNSNDKANSPSVETSGSMLWFKMLRYCLELAGPSFIKLGQWAGSRTDLFPAGFCHEVMKLHSNVNPHSLEYTKLKVCSALDIPQEDFDYVFQEFSDEPIGIGAIAQVHLATFSEDYFNYKQLKSSFSNRDVAIKIIHPSARTKINRDLKIMNFFANLLDSIPTIEWLSFPDEVREFSYLMNLQLDLRIECLNLNRFNDNFKDNIKVKFPIGHIELTTRDVLFEEFIDGLPIQECLNVKDYINDYNPLLFKKISDPFINAFLQMLILDDFVHADLHPGNVLVRFIKTDKYENNIISTESESSKIIDSLKNSSKNGNFTDRLVEVLEEYTPQVCFIDTGLITELNETNRVNFIDLFNALARFDGYRAGELMIERSKTPETAIDKELFAIKTEKLIAKVKKKTFTLGTVSIGELLDQMLNMVRYHHVRLEGDFVSVIVAILLLEGIGRQLDPNLDLFERFVFSFYCYV